jgi:hypothetical protein
MNVISQDNEGFETKTVDIDSRVSNIEFFILR